MAIYSNKSASKSLRAVFQKKSNFVGSVKIASAFFNYDEIVRDLNERGVKVDIIVRLSEATSPTSLKKIYNLPNIQVRYFTSKRFHPKFYIFGDLSAVLGSANFTDSGFNSNDEVCIEVPGGSEDFDDLAHIFQSYWDEALALTDDVLKEYESLWTQTSEGRRNNDFEQKLFQKIGDHASTSEIVAKKSKKDKKTVFTEDYERTYQVFEKAFRVVEKMYVQLGKRKIPEDILPLRIEIDQFFNYVRIKLTQGESYNDEPLRTGDELERFIIQTLENWFATDWPYLTTVAQNYQIILRQFASEERIDTLSLEEIFDALDVCHAFHEQLRFHQGGHSAFKKAFLRDSKEENIKNAIKYLLYGKDRYTVRLANCIFGVHKVDFLSRYSYQELLGWVNHENIPICNTRTLKALRYLGAIGSAIPYISRTNGLKLEN